MSTTISAPTIEIYAPIQMVWEILDNFDHYPDWNPLTVHIRTSRVVGEPIFLDVRKGKSFKSLQTETLEAFQPPCKLAWGTRFPRWLLRATRWQELEQVSPDQTRYQTHETFSGFLEPLIMQLYQHDIQQGFIKMSQALKQRAETVHQS